MSERSITLSEIELKELVVTTVHETLTSIGVDVKDPITMQRDFAWVRGWRESSEQVTKNSLKVIVTVFISGIIGAVWFVIKSGAIK